MGKARIIVIGEGDRIRRYLSFALRFPHLLEIVGIAEPCPAGNDHAAENGSVPRHNRFGTWEEILSRPVFADGAVVASSSEGSPWTHALERGYHLMIENPEDLTACDCASIIAIERRTGLSVSTGHPLRHDPFYIAAKQILDNGRIGDIRSVSLGRTAAGSGKNPACASSRCHDIDLLGWLTGARPSKVFSAGGNTIFRFPNGIAAALCENITPDHAHLTLRVDGTEGIMKGVLGEKVRLSLYLNGKKDRKSLTIADTPAVRRSSQDEAVRAFISAMSGPACITAEESLGCCRTAFAAGQSRTEERMIDLMKDTGE